MTDVRPRLASLTRDDGVTIPLAVHATTTPDVYTLRTLTGQPVTVHPGDRLWVDVIGAGQTVTVEMPGVGA